jgi:hypothetical protein
MTRSFVLSFLAALCSCAGLHAQGFLWNTAGARAMYLGGSYVPSDSGALESPRTRYARPTRTDENGGALDTFEIMEVDPQRNKRPVKRWCS